MNTNMMPRLSRDSSVPEDFEEGTAALICVGALAVMYSLGIRISEMDDNGNFDAETNELLLAHFHELKNQIGKILKV